MYNSTEKIKPENILFFFLFTVGSVADYHQLEPKMKFFGIKSRKILRKKPKTRPKTATEWQEFTPNLEKLSAYPLPFSKRERCGLNRLPVKTRQNSFKNLPFC
jgi:hypothetical protein